MKRIFQALTFCFLSAGSVWAENGPVVVELFTSQGCSSCPPADEMMEELAQRDDVIALSLHVDYWDYIGWKDEFADPRNAKRQRGYAQTAGRRTVYTPEMIVNGVSEIVGAKPMKLATAIENHKKDPKRVTLDVSRSGDTIVISAQRLQSGAEEMTVHMLRYQPRREARITRGENAGRTIEYVNVTQDWSVLGSWRGDGELAMKKEVSGDLPVVVMIQSQEYGAIVAAAMVQ